MADTRQKSWLQQIVVFAGQPDKFLDIGNDLAEFYIDNEWNVSGSTYLSQADIDMLGFHVSTDDLLEVYKFIKAFEAFLDSDLTAAQLNAGSGDDTTWRKKLNKVRAPDTPYRPIP